MSSCLTILKSTSGRRMSKTIKKKADGNIIVAPYPQEKEFTVEETPVQDFASLAEAMFKLEGRPDCLLIRDRLGPGKHPDGRTSYHRWSKDGTFVGHPQQWLTLDFDKIPLHVLHLQVNATPDQQAAALRDLLPGYFRNAACIWRLSSSAGLPGSEGGVSMHLTFWLDQPMPSHLLAAYVDSINVAFKSEHDYVGKFIDLAFFQSVQPHYTAPPAFINMKDPVTRRSAILPGKIDTVAISEEWAASPQTEQSWVAYAKRIGDDKDGFHHAIMSTIASWAAFAAEPSDGQIEEFKKVLRSYISGAPAGARSATEIERYMSDRFLNDKIAWAIDKDLHGKISTEGLLAKLCSEYVSSMVDGGFVGIATRTVVSTRLMTDHYSHLTRQAGPRLLHMGEMRRVHHLERIPGKMPLSVVQEEGQDVFNTWPGRPAPALQPGDVSLFLSHLSYLVDDDADANLFLQRVIAFYLRDDTAGDRLNFMIILGSQHQGIGKSWLSALLRAVLGIEAVVPVTTNAMAEKFNQWATEAEIGFVDELSGAHRAEIVNNIKPIITDDYIMIRPLGGRAYRARNRISLIGTTNYINPVNVSPEDRRFWMWFTESKPRDPRYYKTLFEWTGANGTPAIMRRWAEDMDMGSFNPKAAPPMTAAKEAMREASTSALEAFIRDAHEACTWPLQHDLVITSRLLSLIGRKFNGVTTDRLGRILKSLGGRNLNQKRMKDGSKPVIWAVRDADTYMSMGESALVDAYKDPGTEEDYHSSRY